MGRVKISSLTRDCMREFYNQHPMDPVPLEMDQVIDDVQTLSCAVAGENRSIVAEVGLAEMPFRIDDNFWRNRMFCEQAAETLRKIALLLENKPEAELCSSLANDLMEAERHIFSIQEENTSKVATLLKNFLPDDFRASIIESKKKSDEKEYEEQIRKLMKKGGSIRQKYDLYLQQQHERRDQISSFADGSAVNKVLIALAGIPDELLDFARRINDKDGPMEEQRQKYGSQLYKVSNLGNSLNILVASWHENFAKAPQLSTILPLLARAVPLYCSEVKRVIGFIGDIFYKSPFFTALVDIAESKAEEQLKPTKTDIAKAELDAINDKIKGGFKKFWGTFSKKD